MRASHRLHPHLSRVVRRVAWQGTFVGGALDDALKSPDDNFPLDVCGRPTFRPSAKWFLSQTDFTTATKPLSTRMSSIVTVGSDLQLNKKVSSTFYDEFDGLHRFPFDVQASGAYPWLSRLSPQSRDPPHPAIECCR